MNKPLCFIIMPFGQKSYKVRGAQKDTPLFDINFDKVYTDMIEPAIIKAGMEPIRADKEKVQGIIHKPMFERIILCEYVLADITGANANAFYELGIRHAVKPYTTVSIFNGNSELPFDVNMARAMPYTYTSEGKIEKLQETIDAIAGMLDRARNNKDTDSPIYQLVNGISFQNSVAHEKTDIFRDLVLYNESLKKKLAEARQKDKDEDKVIAIDKIVAEELQKLEDQETGVLIDVMLSYRAAGDFKKMLSFIESLPLIVQQTTMVQEQYGFALNRDKRRKEAEDVLLKLIEKNKDQPSSETYGILGRVYKDWFDEYDDPASPTHNAAKAAGFLTRAIQTYKKGFEADWRDGYPGINAVTLSSLKNDEQTVKQLSPVVEYSVQRKMATKTPDYYDYATLMELAVLNNEPEKARANAENALACYTEKFMIQTSINNLTLLLKYRKKRGQDTALIEEMIATLQ